MKLWFWMLRMCVYMHSRFVENHPIWIVEDGPLIFWGGSVTASIRARLGLNPHCKHLKIATTLTVRTSPYKDYSSLLRWQANCIYILQLRNCINKGMLWFLECSSYFLVDDLILLFVALIELLWTVYASFSIYGYYFVVYAYVYKLVMKSPLGRWFEKPIIWGWCEMPKMGMIDPSSVGTLTFVRMIETFIESVLATASERFPIADHFFFFWWGRIGHVYISSSYLID
jgi:hypothetical protein